MFLKQKNFQKISTINNHQVLNSILIVRNDNEQRSSNKEVVVSSNAKILYQGKKYVISNESFWLTFFKHRHKKLSFCNLVLGEQGWNYVAQQIFLAHRTIYFSQLLKTIFCLKLLFLKPNQHFLLEFSNMKSRIQCKICSNLTIEAPDVVLVFLLLTLNVFGTLFFLLNLKM